MTIIIFTGKKAADIVIRKLFFSGKKLSES